MNLTVAEYFAGIGLVRMGLEPYGWRVAFANDISLKKFEMYKTFFPDAESHYLIENVFKLNVTNIPQTTLATCSFPCVDLSLAGNMKGFSGGHSSAFWGFIEKLRDQKDAAPPLVMLENVPGWLHSNKGADFRLTVQAINELGYACDVFTMNALRFTPQSRLRVFLIGTKFPADQRGAARILDRSLSLLPDTLRRSIEENLDLQWFYNHLPDPPPLYVSGLSEIVEHLDHLDPRWWSEVEINRHLNMMDSTHYKRVEALRDSNVISYRTFFRRRRQGYQRAELRNDDLAGCLRAAVGGSGKQFLIKAGQGVVKMRTMTPREYARLQGVPDKYLNLITANGVHALTGFGDAVCVPVIQWIAKHALTPLVAQKWPKAEGINSDGSLLPSKHEHVIQLPQAIHLESIPVPLSVK